VAFAERAASMQEFLGQVFPQKYIHLLSNQQKALHLMDLLLVIMILTELGMQSKHKRDEGR
jgi:hypothetical protein